MYTKALDEVDEIEKFLEIHKPLIQEEIGIMNEQTYYIINKDLKLVIQKLQIIKSPDADAIRGEFYRTLTEQLTPVS